MEQPKRPAVSVPEHAKIVLAPAKVIGNLTKQACYSLALRETTKARKTLLGYFTVAKEVILSRHTKQIRTKLGLVNET